MLHIKKKKDTEVSLETQTLNHILSLLLYVDLERERIVISFYLFAIYCWIKIQFKETSPLSQFSYVLV